MRSKKVQQESYPNIVCPNDICLIKGDITRSEFLIQIFQNYQFDGIIHLAAIASVQKCQIDPINSQKINYEATFHLLELAKKYNVKKFIFASSAAIYGDLSDVPKREKSSLPSPISLYGLQKYSSEQLVKIYTQLSFIEGTSFRFFNVYGPNQDPSSPYSGVLSIFLSEVITNIHPQLTIYGNGEQTRDFIHVTDIIDNLENALSNEKMIGGIFNLGTGIETRLVEIIDILSKLSSKKITLVYKPQKTGDIFRSYCDPELIKTYGIKPQIKIEDGLKSLFDHYHLKSFIFANSLSYEHRP